MMGDSVSPKSIGFPLRLVRAEDFETSAESSGLTPQMSLRDFFSRWFLPIVLRGEKTNAASTIRLFEDSLEWWERITGDPPLRLIDDYTLAAFHEGLRAATFRRGKLGREKPLSQYTILRHLKHVQQLLERAGPQIDPRKPAKQLVGILPRYRLSKPIAKPKPHFTLEEAQKVVAASIDLTVQMVPGYSTPLFFRGLIGMAFVSGYRVGTLMALEWPWLVEKPDGWWIEAPSEAVPKTGKWKDVALPGWLAEALLAFPRKARKIFPWHCHDDHLDKVHYRLQALARVRPDQQLLGWNAWRRTHATQMAALGAGFALSISQRALDHGDARTTSGHYVDVENLLRRQLPPLWDGPPVPDRQQRLF